MPDREFIIYRVVPREATDPQDVPFKRVELARITDETAMTALLLYAGRNGLVGTPQGKTALAVLGVGLIRAEKIVGCTCDQRRGAYWDAAGVCRCRSCREPILGAGTAPAAEIALSDRQQSVVEFLAAAGRGSPKAIRQATGATQSTIKSLVGLGLLSARSVGGRGSVYSLNPLAHEILERAGTASTGSGPGAGVVPGRSRLAASTTTNGKGTTVSTTTTQKAETTPAATPAPKKVVDVAGLQEALIEALARAGLKTDAKFSHTRVDIEGAKGPVARIWPHKNDVGIDIPNPGSKPTKLKLTKKGDIAAAVKQLKERGGVLVAEAKAKAEEKEKAAAAKAEAASAPEPVEDVTDGDESSGDDESAGNGEEEAGSSD